MAGLTSSLSIATSSLMFNQAVMSTISHNLANVNNPNYSRQQVQAQAQSIGGISAGVTINKVSRQVDQQILEQLTKQQSISSYNDSRQQYMAGLDLLFGTPSSTSGIGNVMSNFFDELNNLSSYPDSTSQRQSVVQQASFLSDQLNSINAQLKQQERDIDNVVDDTISTVNAALKSIGELNVKVAQLENSNIPGQNANDLRDERQRQINIVADALSVNVHEDAFGRAIITTDSGQVLVDSNYTQLERSAPDPGSSFAGIGIRSLKSDGTPANTLLQLRTDRLGGGSIKALTEVRDTELEKYVAQADELSRTLIEQVNQIHSRGVGVPPPSSLTSQKLTTAGTDLFSEIGLVPGSSFDVSVVDKTTGAPAYTTTVTLPAVGPFSGANLATTINTALTGAGFPASVTASFTNGQLTVADSSSTYGVVMGNDADDFLGKIVMNPFFDGSGSADIAVRQDIIADPGLLAAAQMRSSDGGLSLNDSRNAVALAGLGTSDVAFNAAGGVTAQLDTFSGYISTLTAKLAVTLQDNSTRVDYNQTLLTDLQTRNSAASGVNTDEELANLVTFQNAFQASSKVIQIVDKLYDSLLSLV